jgi:hypothetical protein
LLGTLEEDLSYRTEVTETVREKASQPVRRQAMKGSCGGLPKPKGKTSTFLRLAEANMSLESCVPMD